VTIWRFNPVLGRECKPRLEDYSRCAQVVDASGLPLDLTEWVGKETLCAWIVEEILQLDWNSPRVVEYLGRHPNYRPKAMLAILCLGYSIQVFSSSDLVARCRADADFVALCEGNVPFPEELTRFRRKNRLLIKEILTRTFKRAWLFRCASGFSTLCGSCEKELSNIASTRIDVARHMDACD
jgi:hypothetical protein